MTYHIIFVGGIHGVGKTAFCQRISQHLDIAHVAASTLIRQAGIQPSDSQKRVDAIEGNQDVLLRGLLQYRTTAAVLLLDGHFCLLNKASGIEKVPLSTFVGMAPKAIIVLEDSIQCIHERLQQRDQVMHNSSLLTDLQACELTHAQDVSQQWNIPLLVYSASQVHTTDAIDFVRNYIPA